jgi:hypothetical protein
MSSQMIVGVGDTGDKFFFGVVDTGEQLGGLWSWCVNPLPWTYVIYVEHVELFE